MYILYRAYAKMRFRAWLVTSGIISTQGLAGKTLSRQ
jgi:hypothetical protein